MIDQFIIEIPGRLWTETIDGLRKRSKGREAACIWAGSRRSGVQEVKKVFFLDDLVGVKGFARRHNVSRNAINQLFEMLRDKKLSIIADLHTHPGTWVGLSEVDMSHPLEYRIGIIMAVIPYYAAVPIEIENIGVHEYCGNGRWRQLLPQEVKKKIKIMEN